MMKMLCVTINNASLSLNPVGGQRCRNFINIFKIYKTGPVYTLAAIYLTFILHFDIYSSEKPREAILLSFCEKNFSSSFFLEKFFHSLNWIPQGTPLYLSLSTAAQSHIKGQKLAIDTTIAIECETALISQF